MQGCARLSQGGCIMKSIKVYADERNITHQAVYQLISTHKNELEEHIVKDGRTRYITPEAEDILDGYRNKSAIVIESQNNSAEIEQLRIERESLLIKVAAQADEIAELAKWKADNAVALAYANYNERQLEQSKKEVELLEGFLKDAKSNIEHAEEEKKVAVKEAEDRVKLQHQEAENKLRNHYQEEIKRLQSELNEEKNKTWWDKLRGK